MERPGPVCARRALCPCHAPRRGAKVESACENWKDCGCLIFGTRRRQRLPVAARWCVEAVKEGLGQPPSPAPPMSCWRWTYDLEAIGTNAQELPDGRGAAVSERRYRIALGALPYSRSVAPHLWRQSLIALPDAFRHQAVSAGRARMAGGLDRLSARQRAANRRRRRDHQVVEATRPRPPGKTAGVFRRHGRRIDRGDLSAF